MIFFANKKSSRNGDGNSELPNGKFVLELFYEAIQYRLQKDRRFQAVQSV